MALSREVLRRVVDVLKAHVEVWLCSAVAYTSRFEIIEKKKKIKIKTVHNWSLIPSMESYFKPTAASYIDPYDADIWIWPPRDLVYAEGWIPMIRR